tara:strand:+ start:422 stop:664 length:243 start_codon:yes stop_codon:yes gene_type:complete
MNLLEITDHIRSYFWVHDFGVALIDGGWIQFTINDYYHVQIRDTELISMGNDIATKYIIDSFKGMGVYGTDGYHVEINEK